MRKECTEVRARGQDVRAARKRVENRTYGVYSPLGRAAESYGSIVARSRTKVSFYSRAAVAGDITWVAARGGACAPLLPLLRPRTERKRERIGRSIATAYWPVTRLKKAQAHAYARAFSKSYVKIRERIPLGAKLRDRMCVLVYMYILERLLYRA